MSLGSTTSCVVTTSGDVTCWGDNARGQLGQGNLVSIGDDEPLDAIDPIVLGGPARAIATNGAQTFALLWDGSIRAWGANDLGQLGLLHTLSIGDDETPAAAESLATVVLGGPAVELVVGQDFACARLDDGAVRCWGANDLGQLGYGHTARIGDDEAPVTAGDVDLGGPVVEVTAGAHHACARREDGTVLCWGANDLGQLGLGHTDTVGDDESPASAGLVPIGAPAVRVVAGGTHTCAVLETGGLRCWGDGLAGQLGYGHASIVGVDGTTPSMMGDVPVDETVVDLAAGWAHTCALLVTGELQCWGDGSVGALGRGDTEAIGDDETPADVGPLDLGPRQATAVFSGPLSRSTCAHLDDGGLRCWGDNHAGQLGGGHTALLGDDPGEEPGDLPNIMILDDEPET